MSVLVGKVCFAENLAIMFDAFANPLCSKLCWHNWVKPNLTGPLFMSQKTSCIHRHSDKNLAMAIN